MTIASPAMLCYGIASRPSLEIDALIKGNTDVLMDVLRVCQDKLRSLARRFEG